MTGYKTLFYAWDSAKDKRPAVPQFPAGVTASVWRPATDGPPPPSLSGWQNWVWWLFDRSGVFSNRGCGVFSLVLDDKIVHSSLVTPRYFRFPMMAPDDLQIGATWTDPAMRGQGLGKLAVAMIHQGWEGEFRRMWYLVEEKNLASIRVIEASGYRIEGTGGRYAWPGLRALGRYRMSEAKN